MDTVNFKLATMNYSWKGKKILIVEDDHINFKFLDILLRQTQIDIIRAENGQQAIDICSRDKNIDLILMDIQLPEVDGYTATRIIRSMYPSLPIIAQTANALSEEKDKCMKAGCNKYMTKPIQKDLLLTSIDEFLNVDIEA
jgi:hypothetical protein